MEEERWVPMKGFEGLYEISDYGRVKSFKRPGNGKTRIMALIKAGYNKKYRSIQLFKDGKKSKTLRIHRLVAQHFIANPCGAICIHHKDGNPTNNHFSNLEWCDYHQNLLYAFATGVRNNHGEGNPNHELTEREVAFMRYIKGLHPKITNAAIARFYGITHTAISDIMLFKKWKKAGTA